MAFDKDKADKSFRKLRKSLRAISKTPSPKRIHNLRTRTRRVEVIVHALVLDHRREAKRFLKAVAQIRKKAGKVRDMDVLIGFAATLSSDGEDECLVRLIERLGFRRVKAAHRLRSTFSARRKQVRNGINQCSAFLDNKFAVHGKRNAANREWSANATATALNVWTELLEWPQLNASNLHSFRLKVKELRYILELAQETNFKFVGSLGEVKDAIGEWHDWNELAAIAAKVLEHKNRFPLMKQIRSTVRAKFDEALSTANAMRRQYSFISCSRVLTPK